MKKDKVREGMWTPWAQLLCNVCHDKCHGAMTRPIDWTELARAREVGEWNYITTTCSECGHKVREEETVASEKNLCDSLKVLGWNAELEQTGGMCSSCTVYLPEEGGTQDARVSHVMITRIYPDLDDKVTPKFIMGAYDSDGDPLWDDKDQLGGEFDEVDAIHKRLKELVEAN